MTKTEFAAEVERRWQAEKSAPYGWVGSERKAKQRIRRTIEREQSAKRTDDAINFLLES